MLRKIQERTYNRLIEKINKGITKGIDLAIGKDVISIKNYVDNQRLLHPELNRNELVDRLINKKKWRAAIVSFAYGLGGFWTLVPNLAHIWRIHGRLVLTIAYTCGYDLNDPELRHDIFVCFALSSGCEELKKILSEAGNVMWKKALLTPVMKRIIKRLPNRIITLAGRRSLVNVTKITPVGGAIVGSIVDFFSTAAIGKAAKFYYC